MQLWPGGQSVEVRGQVDSPDCKVKVISCDEINGVKGVEKATWVTPDTDLLRKIKCEERAEMYQRNYVLHCDSCLVDELLKHSFDSGGVEGFDYEHVKNMAVDPEQWDLEQCRTWLDENGETIPDPDPWELKTRDELLEALGHTAGDVPAEYWEKSIEELQELYRKEHPDDSEIPTDQEELLEELNFTVGDVPDEIRDFTIEQLREKLIQDINDEDIDGLEDFRSAVRDTAHDHEAEIFEWWKVDSWLGEQLINIGECVLDNDYGYWWGRCCTGQQFIMDGVLQRVADRF